jgi:hypothetical protein
LHPEVCPQAQPTIANLPSLRHSIRRQVAIEKLLNGLLDRHLATIVKQESDMAPAGPPIKARVRSDDDVRDVSFDAAPWLAQASDHEIRTLAASGWGGAYPALGVADWSAGHDRAVARMLRCLDRENEARDASGLSFIGLECHVDQGEALAWLKEHRPHLHAALAAATPAAARNDEDSPARASWAERETRRPSDGLRHDR